MKQTNIKLTKVLVLDAEQRSALAVTRSIGTLKNTYVITTDSSHQALAGCSRFSNLYLQSPSSSTQPDRFIDWLSSIITEYSIEFFFPVTEITSQLILINKSKLPKVSLPFADYNQVMKIANKANLVKIATPLGIPTPKSEYYRNLRELNINRLKYPCVLKPELSHIFDDNCWINTQVRILESESDLLSVFKSDKYLLRHGFIIQEYIPGHGAGLFCFYDNGKPKVYFAHKRIREKPPSGGVSVLSESVKVNDILKDYATKILDSVKWHGVAMIEFRVTPDNHYYLMEVNTRFWGSLQLAIDSGVDFPKWVYTTQLGITQPSNNKYRTGIQLRWLLGDLDGLYIYLKSSKYSLNKKFKRCIQFIFGNPFTCKHEINRVSDIKPALYELKNYIKQIIN